MNSYPKKPEFAVTSTRTTINPAYRSSSEAGYTTTRKKFTRPKTKYSLVYPYITHEELKILNDFFNANQGQKFTFKHPFEDKEKICIFAMDELVVTDNTSELCSTKIELAEV
nr:MAG TPA: minor tail protein [Caudoviricetes sp.]